MTGRYLVAVDGVGRWRGECIGVEIGVDEMRGNLVPPEVEIDPALGSAADARAEQITIEGAGCGEVSHGEGADPAARWSR